MRLESVIYEMFGNIMRLIRAQPLQLGGYTSADGGDGGPPGGFIGYLPQTRVAYDLTEALSEDTPASGESLLDNLNHIRYRLGVVEGSGDMGVNAYQDGVEIATGIHDIDFIDSFTIAYDRDDGISVALHGSGVLSDVTYSGVFGEDLSSSINGIADHFDIAGTIHDSSLGVYLNGVRQSATEYTLDGDNQGFTLDFVPISGDTLQVDYVETYEGYYHTHSQYVASGDVYTIEQIDALFAAYAREVNQQIVFTVAGSGVLASGLMPLRIYAHDVNEGATISEVFCSVDTPASSTAIRINVFKNGDTIFNDPSYVELGIGEYTANRTTDFYDNTFIKDDYFQVKLEQGDTIGQDLTVHIRFSYYLD